MTPNQLAVATSKAIQGVPGCKIAQAVGVHESTISRNLNKPEIKALIEREAQEIINRGLKPARRTITRLAAIGNNTKTNDKDMLKLSLDASKHITSMAGLSGTAPSTVINALIQVNQAPQQTAEVQALQQFMQQMWVCSDDEHQEITGIPATHTPALDEPIDIQIESAPGDAQAVDK
jgi:hypothetical protein